jgi:hypothetical protein
MPRIDRRDMLKVMAATAAGAAGAALSAPTLETVLAASPNPGGPVGGSRTSTSTSTPLVLATTAGTTYTSYPGFDFTGGSSSQTWAVAGTRKASTSGGFYERRLALPQGVTLTECKFFLSNPTTLPPMYILSGSLDGNIFSINGSGAPGVTSSSVQTVDLAVTPTKIDNSQLWYGLDIETQSATDINIYGARVGWINNPGLTLFPNPRRIVDGFATPFVSGTTYGPFDATKESDGTTPTGIPVGATAAFCAVQSYTAGALTLFPDGAADPGVANFSATASGPLNLTYMMVPLSTVAKFKIHSYITGKCFVDAWGFAV